MFKPGKGKCVKCSNDTLIVVKKGLCHRCNEAMKKSKKVAKIAGLTQLRTPIKKVSDKRAKANIAYTSLRKIYMEQHPHCQAALRGVCTHEANDIHHLFWSKDREKYMNDFANVMAVCRQCHVFIHSVMTKDEAINKGFKKNEL